jgi:hypothetical protein
VYVAEFSFAVEDFLTPFSGETEGFREWTEEFDDLGDVVVVLTVLRTRLWIEEVVSCD